MGCGRRMWGRHGGRRKGHVGVGEEVPGGARGCPSQEAGKPLLVAGEPPWPGWAAHSPTYQDREGPLRFPDILSLSYLGTSRAAARFLWFPSHPNSGGSGLDAPLISTLGWGDLPGCEISLISSPLSSSGEDDSFLFRGTLRTSNGCLPSKALLK